MEWYGILHAGKRVALIWQGYAATPAVFSPWGGEFAIALPGMRVIPP
jgi:hypothetical protein